MFRNNYTKMFIRVRGRPVMKFADVQFLSHARNIGLREKMRGGYFLFIITKPMAAVYAGQPGRPPVRARCYTYVWLEIIKGLVFFEAFAN